MNRPGIFVSVPFGARRDWRTGAEPVRHSAAGCDRFVAAVCREVEIRAPALSRTTFSSIYFGGCGPSLLSLDQLYRVLQSLCNNLRVDLEEQTLLVLPTSVTEGKSKVLRESGVDRVELRLDGTHLHQREYGILRSAGFTTVGIELAYGTGPAWERLLSRVLALKPDHVVFHPSGAGSPVELLEAFRAVRTAVGTGWKPYALHHYARPGHESRMLAALFGAADVAGFGPAAVSCTPSGAARNAPKLADYLAAVGMEAPAAAESQTAGPPAEPAKVADRLLGKLVRLEGIPRGEVAPATWRGLVGSGLLQAREGNLVLTDQGAVALERVRAELARG